VAVVTEPDRVKETEVARVITTPHGGDTGGLALGPESESAVWPMNHHKLGIETAKDHGMQSVTRTGTGAGYTTQLGIETAKDHGMQSVTRTGFGAGYATHGQNLPPLRPRAEAKAMPGKLGIEIGIGISRMMCMKISTIMQCSSKSRVTAVVVVVVVVVVVAVLRFRDLLCIPREHSRSW